MYHSINGLLGPSVTDLLRFSAGIALRPVRTVNDVITPAGCFVYHIHQIFPIPAQLLGDLYPRLLDREQRSDGVGTFLATEIFKIRKAQNLVGDIERRGFGFIEDA